MSDTGNPTDIDTVIIFTSDIENLADFYRSASDLGEPLASSPEHIGFRLPSLYLGFDRMDEAQNVASGISLWFRVDNLDETYTRLLELGATSRYAPVVKPMGDSL
jgi:hypothetical protein